MGFIRRLFGLEAPTFGAARSPQWEGVARDFRAKHPRCEVCGTKGTLLNPINIHHCRPFHLHPELELEESNLWTLCRHHHILFGHFMDWKSFNPTVKVDSADWHMRIVNRTY